MPKKRNRGKHNPTWAKAQKLCRLNAEDVRMAKELGLNPRSLMKNIPSKDEQWKAPVKYWIRDLYEKKKAKAAKKARRKAQAAEHSSPPPAASSPPPLPPPPAADEEIPF